MPGLDRQTLQGVMIAAGDALRRDDRPAAAAKWLRKGLDLGRGGPGSALICVQLAGVMQQVGLLDVAVDLARTGLAGVRTAGEEALALDTLIGSLLSCGELAAADRHLERLAQIAPQPAQPAVWFRRAARHRMSGDLERADAGYARVARLMEAHQPTAGAAAAARMGQAEVALFAGDGARAREHYAAAGSLWTAAGRRDGLYRTEAGMVRAALVDGESVLTAGLAEPIAYARDRQLQLLLAHLLVVRGAARHSDADLSEAVALAKHIGAVFLEGRARLVRSRRGHDYADGERTRALLSSDSCWRAVLEGQAPCPW